MMGKETMTSLPLQGKHALVCGASEGIGRASAFALADLGATVTVLARRLDKLDALREALPCPAQQTHAALSADTSAVSMRWRVRVRRSSSGSGAPAGCAAADTAHTSHTAASMNARPMARLDARTGRSATGSARMGRAAGRAAYPGGGGDHSMPGRPRRASRPAYPRSRHGRRSMCTIRRASDCKSCSPRAGSARAEPASS